MNYCSDCLLDMYIINNYYTCYSCGITNNSFIYDNPEINICKVNYTRLNHLKFKLNKLNAKDCDKIPQRVLNILKNEKFDNIHELRSVMKKHKLGFYYKNVHYIYLLIKGKTILSIDCETQEIITQKFIQICYNYFNCEENRIQFINYNYFIFKICCMLNKYDYAKHIPFIYKHKKTIKSYDDTFKAICEKLNWQFTPTYEELKRIYS